MDASGDDKMPMPDNQPRGVPGAACSGTPFPCGHPHVPQRLDGLAHRGVMQLAVAPASIFGTLARCRSGDAASNWGFTRIDACTLVRQSDDCRATPIRFLLPPFTADRIGCEPLSPNRSPGHVAFCGPASPRDCKVRPIRGALQREAQLQRSRPKPPRLSALVQELVHRRHLDCPACVAACVAVQCQGRGTRTSCALLQRASRALTSPQAGRACCSLVEQAAP